MKIGACYRQTMGYVAIVNSKDTEELAPKGIDFDGRNRQFLTKKSNDFFSVN